jgi:hypothetical protein
VLGPCPPNDCQECGNTYWKLRNDNDTLEPPPKPPTIPCALPGLYPDPFNNGSFFECVSENGTLTLINHTCPDGFHFNNETSDIEEACEFTCPDVGIYPNPIDENSYFKCAITGGKLKPEKIECPEGSHFDKTQKVCTSDPLQLLGTGSQRCLAQNAEAKIYDILNCKAEDSQKFTLVTPVSVIIRKNVRTCYHASSLIFNFSHKFLILGWN